MKKFTVYILFSGFEVYPEEINVVQENLTPFQIGEYSFLEWGRSRITFNLSKKAF
jgi:hypothetical protein